MNLCGDIKWIPSIDLEAADPNCGNKYHFTNLSALNRENSKDSRSRSSVSYNTVREESYSVIDIINEFAPSHAVEMDDDELYPTKARSQRWPLPKKYTKISSMIWYKTECIINRCDMTHKLHIDECNNTLSSNDKNNISVGNGYNHLSIMDDLWHFAGKTLENVSRDNNYNDNDKNKKKEEYEYKDIEENQEIQDVDNGYDIISNIISNLIDISSFDDKSILLKTDCIDRDQKEENKLNTNPSDLANGNTSRSSSLGSELDIEHETKLNYSSSNNDKEPSVSISYTIDDNNQQTPIPINTNDTNTNTCKLYEFLFDGIDTDTDDDDIFPTTMIEIDYKESNTMHTINNTDQSCLSSSDASNMKNKTIPAYVPCRPLWELK